MTDKFRSAVRLALASSMRGLSIEQQADALEFLCANAGYCPSFNLGLECPAEKGNICRGISRETWLAYFEKQSAESLEDAMLLEKKQAAARRRGAQRISGGPSMTAEQWLADLEGKAKAATPGPWEIGVCLDMGTVRQIDGSILADCRLTTDDGIYNAAFISSADPTTVLRLVAMVRWLAGQSDYLCPPDKFRTIDCSETSEELYPCKRCWTSAAYAATEDRHD